MLVLVQLVLEQTNGSQVSAEGIPEVNHADRATAVRLAPRLDAADESRNGGPILIADEARIARPLTGTQTPAIRLQCFMIVLGGLGFLFLEIEFPVFRCNQACRSH